MNITVNGVQHGVESSLLTPLLDVLREELGITGPKAGCHQGGCGACTVLVDGEPRRACLLPLAYAFVHYYAAQCGFCTSGMMLAGDSYIAHGGTDDEKAIQETLGGHVCRCTGYAKIVEAVAATARGDSFDLTETAVGKYTTMTTGGAE